MKKTVMIVAAVASVIAPVAEAKQSRGDGSARFHVEMDDGGGFCRKVGETVAVSACVKGKDGDAVNSGTVEAWVDDGWTNVVWRRSVDLAKEPVVKMNFSRSTPGTLRIHLSMQGVREKMDRVVFDLPAAERTLTLDEYRDKMKGAWVGQMVGVSWGQPTEFKWKDEIIPEDKVPTWTSDFPNRMAYGNDDLYVEMTFLKTLEEYGLDACPRQAGIDFANSEYKLWCANLAGRTNLRSGIAPPDCSHPRYNRCFRARSRCRMATPSFISP